MTSPWEYSETYPINQFWGICGQTFMGEPHKGFYFFLLLVFCCLLLMYEFCIDSLVPMKRLPDMEDFIMLTAHDGVRRSLLPSKPRPELVSTGSCVRLCAPPGLKPLRLCPMIGHGWMSHTPAYTGPGWVAPPPPPGHSCNFARLIKWPFPYRNCDNNITSQYWFLGFFSSFAVVTYTLLSLFFFSQRHLSSSLC